MKISNKKPPKGSKHHLRIVSEVTGEFIGWCVVKVIGFKKYKVIETSDNREILKPYFSNNIKAAGRYVFRKDIKKHRRKHNYRKKTVVNITQNLLTT